MDRGVRKPMLLAVLIVPGFLFAGDVQTVKPEELAGLLMNGQKVKFVLKTGTYAEGRFQAIKATQMVVNITKSHNADDLATGTQSIALDRVASITISKYKGNKRTWLPFILCSTAGTLSFLAAGGSDELQGTYIPVAAAFTAGLAVGGYFGGRALDRESLTLVVKYEQASSPDLRP